MKKYKNDIIKEETEILRKKEYYNANILTSIARPFYNIENKSVAVWTEIVESFRKIKYSYT